MKKIIVFSLLYIMFLAASVHAGTEGATNSFYGNGAGASVTTGINNTFLGAQAGSLLTTGSANTFVGYYTGRVSVSGVQNSFMGYYAGEMITGSNDLFIGYRAGRQGTTASGNTCVGGWACYEISTGAGNIVFGHQAGYKVGARGRNTLVGAYAGQYTTGDMNTFSGYAAGIKNTSGSFNAYLGRVAGAYNTTGTHNVAAGYYAIGKGTAGTFNTAVGNYAGYYALGNSNVFIGYRAGYNETGSNKLYITNSNTSSPLIYGDFGFNILRINGNLGIGVAAPAYPIQLAGGAYLSAGGVWTDASSREYKESIQVLSRQQAMDTLENLTPVTFVYKTDRSQQHLGFIAEDVPELVATKNRDALSSMDVVAVLTKVAKEQQVQIERNQKIISANAAKIAELERRLQEK